MNDKVFSSRLEISKPNLTELKKFLSKNYSHHEQKEQEIAFSNLFLKTLRNKQEVGRFVEDFILTTRYNLKMIRPRKTEKTKLIFVCERNNKQKDDDINSPHLKRKGVSKRSTPDPCNFRLSFDLNLSEVYCFTDIKGDFHNHEPYDKVGETYLFYYRNFVSKRNL